MTVFVSLVMRMKYTKKNRSKEVKHSGNTEHSKSSDTQQDRSKANVIKRTRDEEIKACFDAAKQNLDGLLNFDATRYEEERSV